MVSHYRHYRSDHLCGALVESRNEEGRAEVLVMPAIISVDKICSGECGHIDCISHQVGEMLGLQAFQVRQLHGRGLRPCATDRCWGYRYRCQDVQNFAYDLEVPLGISISVPTEMFKKVKNTTQAYKYVCAIRRERASLIRPEKPIILPEEKPTKRPDVMVTPGFVYLFRWNDLYKIGMSGNPRKRFQAFSGLPGESEIVHTIPVRNMRGNEKAMHDKYAEFRVKNEWFKLPQVAVDEIRSMTSGVFDEQRDSLSLLPA